MVGIDGTQTATTERRSIATVGGRLVEATQDSGGASSAKTKMRQTFSERNLINALKLLGNQERDGDSPIQNIVTGLQEKSGKGLMHGLRSFIDVDNRRAVEVSHTRKGLRPFKVKKPKISEDHSEVSREGTDDLTLRAEEVHKLKACINVDHTGEMFGDCRWWTQTGTPFANQFLKELKEVSGKSCIIITER